VLALLEPASPDVESPRVKWATMTDSLNIPDEVVDVANGTEEQ
jgi:hypothetical protein